MIGLLRKSNACYLMIALLIFQRE